MKPYLNTQSYYFTNDYSEGCHPSILEAFEKNNIGQHLGYGDDRNTQLATEIIQQKIGNENADVYFIAGGTLTNLVALASMLKPYESVISASIGHINTHETGAIEACGHKIEDVVTKDGILRPEDLLPVLNKSPKYHTVEPRVVYISNSTEAGTIYRKEELTELSTFCRSHGLILYMDGARLPAALTAKTNNLTLEDVAALTDMFYIGGTKCGALFGEALVITNDALKHDFKYHLKQRGAMMAKGFAIATQFEVLLKDNLIFTLANHANEMAEKLAMGLFELGFSFLIPLETNQVFPILPYSIIENLSKKYGFYVWEQVDKNSAAIRLVTSWATLPNHISDFIFDLKVLGNMTNVLFSDPE